MHWQDVLLVVELAVLLLIYFDDHAMKRMAEEGLEVQKQSLEAQKQYLELRRKWYDARLRKKEPEKV